MFFIRYFNLMFKNKYINTILIISFFLFSIKWILSFYFFKENFFWILAEIHVIFRFYSNFNQFRTLTGVFTTFFYVSALFHGTKTKLCPKSRFSKFCEISQNFEILRTYMVFYSKYVQKTQFFNGQRSLSRLKTQKQA